MDLNHPFKKGHMYHSIKENRLYNFSTKTETKVSILKGKDKCDIIQFLEDISIWMDDNRDLISTNYLPVAMLAVGVAPPQISAFLYGFLVSRALEKNKGKIKLDLKKMTGDEILKIMNSELEAWNDFLNGKTQEKNDGQEEASK